MTHVKYYFCCGQCNNQVYNIKALCLPLLSPHHQILRDWEYIYLYIKAFKGSTVTRMTLAALEYVVGARITGDGLIRATQANIPVWRDQDAIRTRQETAETKNN